jgi:urea transport system ATP-binding protein
MVPQGREIFARLTVLENLQNRVRASGPRTALHTGSDLRPLSSGESHAAPPRWRSFRRPAAAAGDRSGPCHSASSSASRRADRGNPASIIRDIERVISTLADGGNIAILLVEQYFEFVLDLAAAYLVMPRGEVVLSGRRENMDETAVRSYLTV